MAKLSTQKVIEHSELMLELSKLGDQYFELFGELVLEGMDIETALYKCYNDLIVKPNLIKNGKERKK